MRRASVLVAALCLTACGGGDVNENIRIGRSVAPLAEAGPWNIPQSTLDIGDQMYVKYTGAGPWVGEDGCFPGMTPGNEILREYVYDHFPQTYSIGGYSCRHINGDSSTMSVHATGRALDIMLHTVEGEADNDLGDPIGNWLIENAEAIGIQFIIWDLYTWGAARNPGQKGSHYGGAHPHHDHLHIELSLEASANDELWFGDLVSPPAIEGCDLIPIEGAIVEETSPCFRGYGPNEFWRLVEGEGHGGSLLWTNAWENDTPSNWGRWNLQLESAGHFDVEVYIDPAWAVHKTARYAITHADGETVVTIDQSEHDGWVSLGSYDFDPSHPQHVDLYDNELEPVEDDQHVAADALRLTGEGFEPPVIDPTPGNKTPSEEPSQSDNTKGVSKRAAEDSGCSVSTPSSPQDVPTDAWLLMVAACVALRRTHRRP